MKINCKQSAVRSSELRDHDISWKRKLELWIHITVCRFCRIYDKQIKKLGRFSRLLGEATCCDDDTVGGKTDIRLSEEAKSRIKRDLSA
jgi:hypothetical protein